MDFTSPAATKTAPAATTTRPGLPVAGPGPAACRQLPFPRFVAASSPRWSPPASADTAAAPPPVTSRAVTSASMAAHGPEPARAGGDAADDKVVVEDRMDLLWEDFNEELVLRRARGGSWREGGRLAEEEPPWSESSDAESEPAGRAGCAPVLRPSSRAGAAGHYRRRAGSWVLLMRIFRRLFVIEKTISSAAARQGAATTRAR